MKDGKMDSHRKRVYKPKYVEQFRRTYPSSASELLTFAYL